MGVQQQLTAAWVLSRLANPENTAALGVKCPFPDKVIDRPAGFKGRIELQQRLRPQGAPVQVAVDLGLDPLVGDIDETSGVAPVVLDQALPEIKYIHLWWPDSTRGMTG